MDFNHFKQVFHRLSYLQYPLYLLAFFFSIKPYFNGLDYAIEHLDILISNLNYFFIFLGLGISFSSLQDVKKINFKFEEKIVEDTKKAKFFILITSGCMALMLVFGAVGYFVVDNKYVNEISIGVLILGISFIGIIKLQLEQVELHCKSTEKNEDRIDSIDMPEQGY